MARIIIDTMIRHGKPTVEGTRITVDDIMGWLESGMSYDEITREYGITKAQILAAISPRRDHH
ncbi:DUF433 domain-containing protein [Candidatus Woesearchaeota archaeon]|nr:DUF433 domain-containing protein [Candidatus Woesearchaeota archaeon]